jgi:hypothetical protein
MNKFDSAIAELRAQGYTSDQIIDMFDDALDEAETMPIELDYIDEYWDAFEDAWDKENVSIEDVANLATAVVALDDDAEWSQDEMKMYHDIILDNLKTCADLIKKDTADVIHEAVGKAKKEISGFSDKDVVSLFLKIFD